MNAFRENQSNIAVMIKDTITDDMIEHIIKGIKNIGLPLITKENLPNVVRIAVGCCIIAPIGVNTVREYDPLWLGASSIRKEINMPMSNSQWKKICVVVATALPKDLISPWKLKYGDYWPLTEVSK
jgi:hypothetical protein